MGLLKSEHGSIAVPHQKVELTAWIVNYYSSGVLDSWVCCGLKSDRLEPQRRHVGRTLFIRSAQGEAEELNEISGNTGIWSP